MEILMNPSINRRLAARPWAAWPFRAFTRLAGLFLLTLLASCQTLAGTGPAISVPDQGGKFGIVAAARVTSDGPGWLVIYRDVDAAPGPVLGWAAVTTGVSWNVRVKLGPGLTQHLWAVLHVDAGEMGSFEYPGPDAPVAVDGRIIRKRFELGRECPRFGGMGMGGGY
jgi:hypothetical protein